MKNLSDKGNSSIVLFVVAMLGATVISGCHGGKHKEKPETFKVTSPIRKDQEITNEYVAQVRAIQHIEMRAFERGYLQNIFVDEGQLVKKDEKMFEIMPTLVQAEFNKAKAEMDLASIELKNTQSLYNKSVVSKNELALAKAKFEKAKAEVDLAQVHLSMTTVKAPFDGLMDRFQVRLGSLVEEGELLTTLSDISKMWVYFNVSESDYLNFKNHEDEIRKLPVRLRMANGEIFKESGNIDTIEADFDNETGNIAFRASFPNPDNMLRHGETGSVMITVPVEKVLVIPQKATFEVLDKKFVYVVDDKNKVQTREIKIANELPNVFLIEDGLKETDKFLIEGIGKVEQGQEITVDFEEPGKVLANLDLPAE